MSRKFTSYLCMLLLLLSRPSLFAQTNTALRFNSFTQDHATTTNATVIPDMGSGGFTVELWAYVPLSEGGTHSFISQGSTTGFQFGIGYNGSNNHIYVGDMWPDANANVIMGQWNHIALVSSPSGDSAWLYLNGVRVDSTNAFSISTADRNCSLEQMWIAPPSSQALSTRYVYGITHVLPLRSKPACME